jgi:20S proteasome alpha/beta subunit
VTLLVGIRCDDGVVLASDSAATYAAGTAFTIGQQEVPKVYKLSDRLAYASTGAIGVSQLIMSSLQEMDKANFYGKADHPTHAMAATSKAIAEAVRHVHESASRVVPLVGMQEASITAVCKSLVAAVVKKEPSLFQFDVSGAPEEIGKDLMFVALGSGQPLADPFLALLKRILWRDRRPKLPEGRFVAAWTIRHVSQTVFGLVGGPIQMASVSCVGGVPHIDMADPAEHDVPILEAEAALRQHIVGPIPEGPAAEPPAPPAPPP